MGAALAVVDRWEDLRSMAHDALDTWLDQVEAGTLKAPTLREISERFMASRLALLSACLEAVIRQQYAAELQQTEAVGGCGRRLRRRRLDAKEFSTLHGCVTLHRPYAWTPRCCDVNVAIIGTQAKITPVSGMHGCSIGHVPARR